MSGTQLNVRTVRARDYNQARSILANAGSQSARKSHPVHDKPDVPVAQGQDLLREARDEFREMDAGLPDKQKKSRMSQEHYKAVHDAADTMGISHW
ncbi:hypothetical protein [Streptomyces sp. TRM64462]|uniref:hypothetical protein n=1 Tax=Streptomyces sp. TRM64462 TaxID=2741726 RepID=UPI00158630B4|nr:hypothetical protein [Streptomyces sp. TRM64462]